jgi:hypothetical protein
MNIKKVLPILLIALAVLGCDKLKDAFTKGVAKTASRINSVQAIGGSKEFAFVDIEYVFTGTGVSDEKAVFGRDGSDKRDTVDIEAQGTVYLDVDTLAPNTTYNYNLWLLDGDDLIEYDEVTVKTLPILKINTPLDTLTEGPLEVTWDKLTYEGEDYLDYEVSLFDADEEGIDLENPDLQTLLALTTPVEGPFDVKLDAADTEGSYTFTYASQYFMRGFIVKVTTNKGIGDKLSNKSTAFKPFLWVGEPPK